VNVITPVNITRADGDIDDVVIVEGVFRSVEVENAGKIGRRIIVGDAAVVKAVELGGGFAAGISVPAPSATLKVNKQIVSSAFVHPKRVRRAMRAERRAARFDSLPRRGSTALVR
jgi:hypothetical protein